MNRHPFTVELIHEGHELQIDGYLLPGCPERGPSWDCGGSPAEPDEIEDVTFTLVKRIKGKLRSREIQISDSMFGELYDKIFARICEGDE